MNYFPASPSNHFQIQALYEIYFLLVLLVVLSGKHFHFIKTTLQPVTYVNKVGG
jgi:hypothetical protein